jgi:hypothetical protein
MVGLSDSFAELDGHIEGLYSGKLVAEDDIRRLCEKVKEVLQAESNVVPVRAPITIVRPRAPLWLPWGERGVSAASTQWGLCQGCVCPSQQWLSARVACRVRRLATSMASSRTCWNLCALAAGHRTRTTCS